MELLIVIVLLGILSAYYSMKSISSADATLPSQAQKLAADLRHAQTLAVTCGESWRVTYSSDSTNKTYTYTVAPKSGSSTVCGGKVLTYTQNKLRVTLSGPSPLDFDSLGQPSAATAMTYALTSDTGATFHIYVATITGRVRTDVPGAP